MKNPVDYEYPECQCGSCLIKEIRKYEKFVEELKKASRETLDEDSINELIEKHLL